MIEHITALPDGISCVMPVSRPIFCHIESDGHYWRTSSVQKAAVVLMRCGKWEKRLYAAEPQREEDEYSILKALISCPDKNETLCSFGGTAFLLPYLRAKCKAYGLDDPFDAMEHMDLAEYLRPLYTLLGLPSRRLADYLAWLGLDPAHTDGGDSLTALVPYLAYRSALLSARPETVEMLPEGPAVRLALPFPVPKAASYRAGSLVLRLSGSEGTLFGAAPDGRIRLYYDDPENYLFVSAEGTAMHRSVASVLPKDRTEPCTYETCYTKIPASALPASDGNLARWTSSSLTFLQRSIRMKKLPHDLRQPE